MIHLAVFTDASWCRYTKVCGWGLWARAYRRPDPIVAGGSLPGTTANSSVAEMWAMRAGIEHLGRHIETRGLNVLIQSDSAVALACILKLRPETRIDHRPGDHVIAQPRRPEVWRTYEYNARQLAKAIEACRFETLTIRHIRGHGTEGARSEANNRCDELAKAGMRAARKALKARGDIPGAPEAQMPAGGPDS